MLRFSEFSSHRAFCSILVFDLILGELINPEYDFAKHVACPAELVRHTCLRQRQDRLNEGSDLSRIHQVSDVTQFNLIWLDKDKLAAHLMSQSLLRGRQRDH